MIDYNELTSDEYFQLCWALMVANADVSDFKEDEIRCLAPLNPVPLPEFDSWDRKLKSVEPKQMDIGINNKRETFIYANNNWKKQ